MKVIVEFFSTFRNMPNKNILEMILENDEKTVRDLLRRMIGENDFGPRLEKALFEDKSEKLRSMVVVAINGRSITLGEGFDTMLQEGDRVGIGMVSFGG